MRVDDPTPARRIRPLGRTLLPATLLACGSASGVGALPPVAEGVSTPTAPEKAPKGASGASASASAAAERRNWFDDPFLVATHGLPGCPVPEGPLSTRSEMQHEAHWRAERGTSCFQSGRCRLPNAYLYDHEIAPRVVKTIEAAGRFADTSVWVVGQRRWVWLEGCVSTSAQAIELERIVRLIDDVEAVIPRLDVGTSTPPGAAAYAVEPMPAAPEAPRASSER